MVISIILRGSTLIFKKEIKNASCKDETGDHLPKTTLMVNVRCGEC